MNLVAAYFILSILAQGNASEESGYIKDSEGNLLSLPPMRLIPGGEFTMGSPIDDVHAFEYHADEHPRRPVKVNTFYLSQFPVTVEEFCVYLNDRGSLPTKRRYGIEFVDGRFRPKRYLDRTPAIQVTWVEGNDYARWLSDKTGKPYRLPTEEEWEYAERGTAPRAWPWGDEPPPSSREMMSTGYSLSPFYLKRGFRWLGGRSPAEKRWMNAPVGCFPMGQTAEGVYEMFDGQGGEWCSDRYTPAADQHVPPWCNREKMRVVRGIQHKWTNDNAQYRGLRDLVALLSGARESVRPSQHEGWPWTRIGADEENEGTWGIAKIRIAMDAE